jgi:hypothetical protein
MTKLGPESMFGLLKSEIPLSEEDASKFAMIKFNEKHEQKHFSHLRFCVLPMEKNLHQRLVSMNPYSFLYEIKESDMKKESSV